VTQGFDPQEATVTLKRMPKNAAEIAPIGLRRGSPTATSGTMRRAEPPRHTEPPLESLRPAGSDSGAPQEAGPFSPEIHGGSLLVRMNGPQSGQLTILEQSEVTLGRAEKADVRSSDLNVSREHARILVRGESFWIEDLDSTRGTLVNGERVRRHCLQDGDVIELGSETRFRFSVVPKLREAYCSGMYDPLTGAHTLHYFETALRREVASALRSGGDCALICFDLDGFSEFNEKYGYRAGDVVLQQVATTCSLLLRVEDVFARQAGDAFMVLLPAMDLVNAGRVAARIMASIRDQWLEIGRELRMVTAPASAGLATLSECSRPVAEALFGLTLVRLAAAKESGANRVVSRGA